MRAERRLELAVEGQRFFDLERWGIVDTTINNYVAIEQHRIAYLDQAGLIAVPKFRYYPIPFVQVELSKVGGVCNLQQNTGWGTC